AFRTLFRQFIARPRAARFLVAVALGTAAFNMQDIILEPYGAQVLKLSVSGTTVLTALLATGALAAFALAARTLAAGVDPYRLAGLGLVSGLVAFPSVIFAGAIDAPDL
ncbi:MAG: PucC family protein, partial [Hyphomicrobiales bacterium]